MYRLMIAFLLFVSINDIFSQTQNLDKIKSENTRLENENSALKSENNVLRSDNSALKQDTSYQIKKNEFCAQVLANRDFKIEHTFQNYNIQLISCKGDRIGQSVTIEILMTNNNVNHYVNFVDYNKQFAIDLLGNKYSNIRIGDSDKYWILYGEKTIFPTSVPIKVNITIGNVLPSLEIFKIVNIALFYKTDGSSVPVNCDILFKDIKINW